MEKIKNCIVILLSTMFILTFYNKSSFSALSMIQATPKHNYGDTPSVYFQKKDNDVLNQENSDSGRWSLAKIVAIIGISLAAIAGCFLFYRIFCLKRERKEIKISTLLTFNKENKYKVIF